MQTLKQDDYNLLKSVIELKQSSLQKVLKNYLKQKYKEVYSTLDYIYAKGDIPIALVAHMDTVFENPPSNIYYDREKGVLWSPEGLGADDRAGIFAILKILQSGLKPSVIFLADEEKGCLGAEKFVKDFEKPGQELKYIIELDRHGKCDCVFYDCDNPQFVKYIENFGFIENFGSFSDISVICPTWGIAGVNLSVGYEDEHSYIETLHIAPLLRTISNVKKMLKAKDNKTFEYIPLNRWKYYDNFSEKSEKCKCCGNYAPSYDMIPVFDKEGHTVYFCPDCCVDHVQWCENCGASFESTNSKEILCPDCQQKGVLWKKLKHNSKK